MSTRASILFHYDAERRIQIHIYEELMGDSSQDFLLEVRTEHVKINVPWPIGLAEEETRKLSIVPQGATFQE